MHIWLLDYLAENAVVLPLATFILLGMLVCLLLLMMLMEGITATADSSGCCNLLLYPVPACILRILLCLMLLILLIN
jgi:hypothetical protein